MSDTVYARLLPYEAEVWGGGWSWRGTPGELEQVLRERGVTGVTVPTTDRREAQEDFRGIVAATPLMLPFSHLDPMAALSGVAAVRRAAPPFCEGELLAEVAGGSERAVLLLLGPETVGWALHQGRLRDAFRSLDEEAIGGRTTGAVFSRWAIGELIQDGEQFAEKLFTASGRTALGDDSAAYLYRLRMAVGRFAGALGGVPDVVVLGGDEAFCREAEGALSDLAPVRQSGVAWGLSDWAQKREG